MAIGFLYREKAQCASDGAVRRRWRAWGIRPQLPPLFMDGLHLSFHWTARFISYGFGKCGRPFAAGWAHPVISPPAEKAVSKLSTSDCQSYCLRSDNPCPLFCNSTIHQFFCKRHHLNHFDKLPTIQRPQQPVNRCKDYRLLGFSTIAIRKPSST